MEWLHTSRHMNDFMESPGLRSAAGALAVCITLLSFTSAPLAAQEGGECIAGDCQNGVGTTEYDDGSRFYGMHEEGEENKGRLHLADGTVAYGNWYKGRPYMGLFFFVDDGASVHKPETIHYVDMEKAPDSHPQVGGFEGALAITAVQLSELLYEPGEQDLHLYPVAELGVWNIDYMKGDSVGSLLAHFGSLRIESGPGQQVRLACQRGRGGCISDVYGNTRNSISFSNVQPDREWVSAMNEQLQMIMESLTR